MKQLANFLHLLKYLKDLYVVTMIKHFLFLWIYLFNELIVNISLIYDTPTKDLAKDNFQV